MVKKIRKNQEKVASTNIRITQILAYSFLILESKILSFLSEYETEDEETSEYESEEEEEEPAAVSSRPSTVRTGWQ